MKNYQSCPRYSWGKSTAMCSSGTSAHCPWETTSITNGQSAIFWAFSLSPYLWLLSSPQSTGHQWPFNIQSVGSLMIYTSENQSAMNSALQNLSTVGSNFAQRSHMWFSSIKFPDHSVIALESTHQSHSSSSSYFICCVALITHLVFLVYF